MIQIAKAQKWGGVQKNTIKNKIQGVHAKVPVTAGDAETRKQILIYTFWLVAISLALLLVKAGLIYLLIASLLGIVFLYKAFRIWRGKENTQVWGLFKYSIIYLFVLFIGMMADSVIKL